MRKKEVLARFAAATFLFAAIRTASPAARRRLLILGYHRVLPLAVIADEYPFDLDLISATPEEFAWQMQFLSEHYRPVSIVQVAESVDGGAPLPPRAVLVTFDDGFSDSYDFAYPVLRRVGIPACFFVSTDVVGSENVVWFDYVAHILLRAPVGAITLPISARKVPVAADLPARRQAIAEVLAWLKTLSDDDRRDFMTELERQQCELLDPRSLHLSRSLSWSQVREMVKGGMNVGSHGVTHAVLSRLTLEQLDQELLGSRDRLVAETGCAVDAISYPVGGRNAINAQVVDRVRACGYRIGLTNMRGINPLTGFNPYWLRRQHVTRSTTRAFFEGLVSWPAVF